MTASKGEKQSGRKSMTIRSGKKSPRNRKKKPSSRNIESHKPGEAKAEETSKPEKAAVETTEADEKAKVEAEAEEKIVSEDEPEAAEDKRQAKTATERSEDEVAYLQALVALAGTTLAILLTFIAAYSIYSRQNQDKLAVEVQKQIHGLNESLRNLSAVGFGRASFMGNHMNMLQRESWVESPRGIFADDVTAIKQKFDELDSKFKGDFPSSAALLEVRHLVDQLVAKMYCELPSYRAIGTQQRLIDFDNDFVDVNFPGVQSQFQKWSHRVLIYHQEVTNVFRSLSHIISTVVTTERISYLSVREELKDKMNDLALERLLFDVSNNQHTSLEFLQNLSIIPTEVAQINQEIRYYTNFQKVHPSGLSWLLVVLAGVSGTVLPLWRLARVPIPIVGRFVDTHLRALTGLGFLSSILLAGIFLYRDLSVCVTS